MKLDPTVSAALVAGIVSVVVGLVSYISNRSAVRHEVQQGLLQDILAKRIEIYPKLWCINIHFLTNWYFEGKPMTKEWAQQYVSALNEFNLEGGLFFSEDLYRKFAELRRLLYKAIENTRPDAAVEKPLADAIWNVVYGVEGAAGLSTYLKDDLGSYRSVTLQRRISDA